MNDHMLTWNTRPIRLEDAGAVWEIRRQTGHTLSAHAFTSLYMWQNAMGLSIHLEPQAFFVKIRSRGENAWFFPCGEAGQKEAFLKQLCRIPGASLHYLRQEDVAFLENCCPGAFDSIPAREDEEYIYLRQEQVDLPGSQFRALRSKISRGRHHAWEVLPLDQSTVFLAMRVIRAWAALRGDGDLDAAQMALSCWKELNLQGILLLDEGVPVAAAFGGAISENIFDVHVAKTLVPGIDCYMKWELYSRIPEEMVWINMEEDLGLEGLRISKEESLPIERTPLWKAVLR